MRKLLLSLFVIAGFFLKSQPVDNGFWYDWTTGGIFSGPLELSYLPSSDTTFLVKYPGSDEVDTMGIVQLKKVISLGGIGNQDLQSVLDEGIEAIAPAGDNIIDIANYGFNLRVGQNEGIRLTAGGFFNTLSDPPDGKIEIGSDNRIDFKAGGRIRFETIGSGGVIYNGISGNSYEKFEVRDADDINLDANTSINFSAPEIFIENPKKFSNTPAETDSSLVTQANVATSVDSTFGNIAIDSLLLGVDDENFLSAGKYALWNADTASLRKGVHLGYASGGESKGIETTLPVFGDQFQGFPGNALTLGRYAGYQSDIGFSTIIGNQAAAPMDLDPAGKTIVDGTTLLGYGAAQNWSGDTVRLSNSIGIGHRVMEILDYADNTIAIGNDNFADPDMFSKGNISIGNRWNVNDGSDTIRNNISIGHSQSALHDSVIGIGNGLNFSNYPTKSVVFPQNYQIRNATLDYNQLLNVPTFLQPGDEIDGYVPVTKDQVVYSEIFASGHLDSIKGTKNIEITASVEGVPDGYQGGTLIQAQRSSGAGIQLLFESVDNEMYIRTKINSDEIFSDNFSKIAYEDWVQNQNYLQVGDNVSELANDAGYLTESEVDSKIAETTDTNVVDGGFTYSLPAKKGFYSFTGSTSTWTLPAVSNSENVVYYIKNKGSGTLTINADSGNNEIYSSSAVNSYDVTAGSAIILHNDTQHFNVQ